MKILCLRTRFGPNVPSLIIALRVLESHTGGCHAQHRLIGDDGRVWATTPMILAERIRKGETDPNLWRSIRPVDRPQWLPRERVGIDGTGGRGDELTEGDAS